MGYRGPGGAGSRCLCAPWWLFGDTVSPSADLVAAGLSAEVGGGEEAVAAPTGRGARSARCAAAESGVWLQLCGSSSGGDRTRTQGGREGGLGQGTGPRAARPEERVAVPEKDELVSGRPERRFSLLSLQAVETKARAGVGKAQTLQS